MTQEETAAYNKAYREKNRERIKAQNRIWAQENKDKIKSYYHDHKEEKRDYRKIYCSTPRGRFADYKSGARVRNISFDLTFDQFKTFWQVPCGYCSTEIETVGLDRIDNSLGYAIDNCISCCKTCNYMKSDLCEDMWFDHMLKVLKNKGII